MLQNFRHIALFLLFLSISCTSSKDKKEHKQEMKNSSIYNNLVLNLTPKQQSAFDALNQIQRSTDKMNRLYSTFVSKNPPCYPSDTSFVLTQAKLHLFMQQFISNNCQNMDLEIQNVLAKTSTLAQKEYTVLHCPVNMSSINYEQGLPMNGTWYLPGILGRRDLILIW